jgi:hypothetical protein
MTGTAALHMQTDVQLQQHEYRAQFFLEEEMFQTKFVEKIKTHFMIHFSPENRAVYEIMWKNMVQPDRPQTKT